MLLTYEKFIKEGLFDEIDFDIQKTDHGKIVKEYDIKTPITLDCWRGFDFPTLEELESNEFIIDPKDTPDKMLWFTSKLCNISNPYEYANERDTKYFLTYPLTLTKHEHIKEYKDGYKDVSIPNDILDKSDTFEDSKYYGKYELPNGWFFSYKSQKFIVCKIPLKVNKDMINIK